MFDGIAHVVSLTESRERLAQPAPPRPADLFARRGRRNGRDRRPGFVFLVELLARTFFSVTVASSSRKSTTFSSKIGARRLAMACGFCR